MKHVEAHIAKNNLSELSHGRMKSTPESDEACNRAKMSANLGAGPIYFVCMGRLHSHGQQPCSENCSVCCLFSSCNWIRERQKKKCFFVVVKHERNIVWRMRW